MVYSVTLSKLQEAVKELIKFSAQLYIQPQVIIRKRQQVVGYCKKFPFLQKMKKSRKSVGLFDTIYEISPWHKIFYLDSLLLPTSYFCNHFTLPIIQHNIFGNEKLNLSQISKVFSIVMFTNNCIAISNIYITFYLIGQVFMGLFLISLDQAI